MTTTHFRDIFKGTMLVAGTTVGGGMLALPVLTAEAGFFPSIIIYLFCWAFMASTGLLFLEVSQWMKKDTNLVSMAEVTLGKKGKAFAWILYLFLFYCLSVAYTVGCGQILASVSGGFIPERMGPLIFVFLFAPLILIPTRVTSYLNVFFVLGLALSYFGFVVLGFSYVDSTFLSYSDWSYSLRVLPIAFISFAYQGIVPTLSRQLHHDAKAIRKALLIGSFIPFIAYAIWEWLILGIIPLNGEGGLKEAFILGHNAVQPLKFNLQNAYITVLGQVFAFLALLTSFLGVSLGLRDFLADGFKIKKDLSGKAFLAVLVFLIPLAIALSYPNLFLKALDLAGGYGSALLLGMLPILMVWRGRYSLNLKGERELFGGKPLLCLLFLFVSLEIISEVLHLFD